MIKGLPRSERNAAIEETRNALIEAVHHYSAMALGEPHAEIGGKVAVGNEFPNGFEG